MKYIAYNTIDPVKHFIEEASLECQYDMSAAWLMLTEKYMLQSDETLFWHTLLNEKDEVCAVIPLISQGSGGLQGSKMRSLVSFYSSLATAYCNDLARRREYLGALFEHILSSRTFDVIDLTPLDTSDSLISILSDAKRAHSLYFRFNNWYCQVNDFESYWNQRPSKLKNTVKRKANQVAKKFQYGCEVVTEMDRLPYALAQYKKIYEASWKGEEYSYEFINEACIVACQNNNLRLGLVTLDGKVVAAQIWFLKGKTASIFKLCYDPEYRNLSVGSLLTHALFEHLIVQDRVTQIDYGMGDEAYKSDWMTSVRPRVGCLVYNRTRPGGFLAWLRHKVIAGLKRNKKGYGFA